MPGPKRSETRRRLQETGSAELSHELEQSKRELFNLRFRAATNQLENTARIGEVRKNIARILTVLRQRELQEASH